MRSLWLVAALGVLLIGPIWGAADGMGVTVVLTSGQSPAPLLAACKGAGCDRVVLSALDRASLKTIVEACRAHGLGVYAGIELLGPLRDTEGLDLLARHPEFTWVSRNGLRHVGLPCYAYPEVREARLRQIEHALAAGVDGLALIATLPGPAPPNGVAAAYGYNRPVVDRYRERYGTDPRRAKAGSLEQLLFVKLQGDALAEFLSEARSAARARGAQVAVIADRRDTDPATAMGTYVDPYRLLADDLADELVLLNGDRENLLRHKLATDRDVKTGLWADLGSSGLPAGAIERAMQAPGCDSIWFGPVSDAREMDRISAGFAQWRDQRAKAAALAAAIASGEIVVATAAEPGAEPDTTTFHNVAQSFRLDRPVECVGVEVLAARRGAGADALPDLPISLRPDAGGKPGAEVLAQGIIPASAFGYEPAYKWGFAAFDPPVRLEAGVTYWLFGPAVTAPNSSYMWRVTGDPYGSGHAWSSLYPEYANHDLAFRVYAKHD